MSAKPNVDDFTVPEKILLAADQLEKQGHSPFTAEALIVSSWQRFPATFGLKGFAEKHPDSNKILSSIMGEKGLARRGWLVKMGAKLYALTRDGRNVIRRVMMQEEEAAPSSTLRRLTRDQERFLKVLFDSSAFQKFDGNRKADLSFADACRYWSVTENMKGDALDERIEEVSKTLAELDRILADVDAETSSSRVVTAGDIRVLTNIHRYMEDRFDRHLNLLRSRPVKK
ncbi:MAG: hypothetical protein EXS16_21275 [Gemmataceae bacterium]|nr:hypothetical protein [Gemmataceae bacterium]